MVEHHGYQTVCPNGSLLFEPIKSPCPGHFMAHSYHKCLQCNARTIGWVRSIASLLLTFPRRFACRYVSRNIAVSNHVKNRIHLSNSKVILHGIRDAQENKAEPAECLLTPIEFAYAGRLVSEKGLNLLVEAASRLQKDGCAFRLKFIGDGPERARLERAVDELELRERVMFTGYLRGQRFETAISSVTALVMPSICEETAGLSAIEHMMRGRLAIVTDIGGLGEVVGDAGLKFPLGDVKALAARMKRVLDEPNLAKELGQKARQRALHLFLAKRMVEEHLGVYCELLRQSNPVPIYLGEN